MYNVTNSNKKTINVRHADMFCM